MDYKACWEYQQRLFDTLLRAKGTPAEGAGYLLLVEHPAVYTLGKSGHAENLLVGEEYLRGIGAEFYHIDRGGDITFHGPGQIVGYPILDLERIGLSLRDYIDALEGAVIRTVARYGIRAGRIAGASGVWIEGAQPARKICAIGVRASRYVTMHGFALNVAPICVISPISTPAGLRTGVPRRSKRRSVARFRWRRSNDASSKIYARI